MAMPLFVALLSFLFTGLVIGLLNRQQILDTPNGRPGQDRPTPRGGGLAVFAILLPTLLMVAGLEMLWLWLGLVLLLGVSFADDLYDLPALPRFAAQVAAVVLGFLALPTQDPFVTLAGAVLWLWFINVFNFMDGIDGIAGVESLTIGGGAALATVVGGPAGGAGVIGLATAAAALGFLPWNWRPARIFLGEVGSVPLGYLLGFVLLSLTVHGFGSTALILPLIFVTDATLTLFRRLFRGERIWRPHRTHWYQRAAAAAGHDVVAVRVATANVVLVALAGTAATGLVDWPYLLGAAGVVVVLVLVDFTRLARRKPQRPRRRVEIAGPQEDFAFVLDAGPASGERAP